MQNGNRTPMLCPYQFSQNEGQEPEIQRLPANSAAVYPCNLQPPQPQALYTYYAIVSLVVVTLALSLIWIPFVQLIAEFNIIISRVLIYTNRELLGDTNYTGLRQLGEFFNSPEGLIVISLSCLLYLLYVASADFLIFAGCYIYNLPNLKYLQSVKNFLLGLIGFLLSLTGNKDFILVKEKDKNLEPRFQVGNHQNHIT